MDDDRRNAELQEPAGIVLLVAEGALANIVTNYLAARYDRIVVLKEEPESKRNILRRRAKLVSPLYAIGQVMCGVLLKFVAKRSRRRVAEVCAEHAMHVHEPAGVEVRSIGSVNSDLCRQHLREINPQVVAVYGTRIIGQGTLGAVSAPFVNYHAGITPKYRGQHPAYWALVEDDAAHIGVTVHLVDSGVDTGGVLYQAPVKVSPRDNITTYQFVQMATALPVFVRALEDGVKGKLKTRSVELPSRKWFPPTLAQYIANGLRRGIW